MFPLFFGFFGFQWLSDLFNGSNDNMNNGFSSTVGNYTDVFVDNILLNVLKINEGANGTAVEKAYPLKGESGFTIGYGTKYLYLSNGSNFRGNARVFLNDTLSILKKEMGYSNFSSEDFAKQLIVNHIKFDYNFNKGGAKNFFQSLKNKNVLYYREFQVSLIDAGYMSGSFFSSSFGNNLLQSLYTSYSKKAMAIHLFRYHFEYLKTLKNYSVNKKGWVKRLLKRYSLCAYGIFNSGWVENNLKTELEIKKYCLSEMGYILNL